MNCLKEKKYRLNGSSVVIRILQDLFEYHVVCFKDKIPVLRMIVNEETQQDQAQLLGKSATDAYFEFIENWILQAAPLRKIETTMSHGLCPSCGAAVNLTAGTTETKCQYCDSIVTLWQAEEQFNEVKNSKFGGTLLIAETAQEGGSYTEALNYYNKVIEQQPDFADAWLNKGTCTVRTSKIGDLKIPEAISSWKAAIKFAKNPDAMKKRVALEINNAVTDFYPVLEHHYLEFHSLDNSLSEHGSRFMLLESALSLAMELNPTITICKNGISLCDEFVASIKKAAGSDANAAAAQLFQKDWKGALSSAATAGSKEKVASDLEKTLQQTKSKYEQMLAKADPEFARQITIRAENQKLKAVKDAKDAKQGGIGCLMIICVFLLIISGCSAVVRTLKSQGLMETTQEPSEHIGPAVFFSIVSIVLIPVIVVLFRKYKTVGEGDITPAVEPEARKNSAGMWLCRILGPLGLLGGIGMFGDAIAGNNQKPDDPGVGGSIATLLLCAGMTAYGYLPRKKIKKTQQNESGD